MIQTENLTKVYKNGFKAVNGLDLHVAEGDIFGFLGPNGAGKTTTIRMLDGLLAPTRGKAMIAGMDITEHPMEIKRIIGVFILKTDPVACCFHMMSKMLTDKVSFFSLGNGILPLVLFA